jgi:hypothetical protein
MYSLKQCGLEVISMDERIEKILDDLDGISNLEWTKLLIQVNRYFEVKKKELEYNFKLDSKEVKEIIRSQFG